jgi:nickel/cobalt exporter
MRYRRYVILIGCAIVGAFLLWPLTAAAHPLGNFTINHYSRLHFAGGAVQVKYVLDYAEIPTFQMKPDTDGDGTLAPAEADAFLDATLPGLVSNLHLAIGGREEALKVLDRSAAFVPGQGGLPTLRLEATLEAALPSGWQGAGGSYADGNLGERLGWREIVVQGGDGIAINNASVPATDVSNELRAYPENLLTSPLNVTSASFSLVPGSGGTDVGSRAASVPRPAASQGKPTDQVAALITAETLSPTVILVSILVALFWGAAHALSPGHGKTVVAAYLVGSRGTARHAVFLGLTVTLTHTIGVFALGGITLWLSRYLLPETLYPWLNVISGALVIVIALALAYQRLRGILQQKAASASDHSHDSFELAAEGTGYDLVHSHGGVTHSHLPPGAAGTRVTWRGLLALGVSGGLIPCPSALVLLLGAVALGRVGFGIVLVIAFSFGLAILLTAIGLLMVYAQRLFARFSFEARVPRLLPVASALVMALAGVGIVLEALRQAGVI